MLRRLSWENEDDSTQSCNDEFHCQHPSPSFQHLKIKLRCRRSTSAPNLNALIPVQHADTSKGGGPPGGG